MDRALVRDLLQPCALLVRQFAFDGDGALDAVHVTFRILCTLRAVSGMHSLLAQPYGDTLKRPSLASRVERHGH